MARAKRSCIVLSLPSLLLSVLLLPQASAQAMGTVTTLAGGSGGTASGSANGVGTIGTFNLPFGVALSVNASFALVVSSDVLFIFLKRETGFKDCVSVSIRGVVGGWDAVACPEAFPTQIT